MDLTIVFFEDGPDDCYNTASKDKKETPKNRHDMVKCQRETLFVEERTRAYWVETSSVWGGPGWQMATKAQLL